MKFSYRQTATTLQTHQLEAWIQNSLAELLPVMKIEEARIRVDLDRNASPRYRASGLLVIPGPDLHAEVSDHTPATAVAKLIANLKAQIEDRVAKRLARLKHKPNRVRHLYH